MKRIRHWSEAEKQYLKEIVVGKSYKEIQEMMIIKFALDYTLNQIKGAINRYKLNTGRTGYFLKGNIPANKGTKGLTGANKTSFKPGNIPKNYRKVGSERITKDGYIEVKVADPGKWKLKHRIVYENHYGKIKKGKVIVFLDSNKRNVDISNLCEITQGELALMNGNKLFDSNPEITKIGITTARLMAKIKERENGIKKNKK